MRINNEKCVGCGVCVIFCPMDCIKIQNGKAFIDEPECVDCGVCLKSSRCPQNAIYMPEENYKYPRAIRMQFSDPSVKHPKQTTGGRGTEEAKTNDVTAKFRRGEFGLILEFGRPCVGVRFSEMEKITIELNTFGIDVLEDNPIYDLLDKDSPGRFKKDVVNEKVLSSILELRIVGKEKLFAILSSILPLLNTLDTLVSVGLVVRFDEDGRLSIIEELNSMGIQVRENAKINVGLGRPLIL